MNGEWHLLQEGCRSCRCGWRARTAQLRSSTRLTQQRTCSQSATQEHTCKIQGVDFNLTGCITVLIKSDFLTGSSSHTEVSWGCWRFLYQGKQNITFRAVKRQQTCVLSSLTRIWGSLPALWPCSTLCPEAELWWGRNLRSSPSAHSPQGCFWLPGLCGCIAYWTGTPCPVEDTCTYQIYASVEIWCSTERVTKLDRGTHLADLRGVVHELLVVDPLPVFHEVIPQAPERQIFHDETEISSSWRNKLIMWR